MTGMPYDIERGNFDKRAMVSTSALLTAVLKLCQKVSVESGWAVNRSRERVIIVFIMLQSAANTKTKGAFLRCSKGS